MIWRRDIQVAAAAIARGWSCPGASAAERAQTNANSAASVRAPHRARTDLDHHTPPTPTRLGATDDVNAVMLPSETGELSPAR